jgi:molybdate transport system substrate-binding protein
MATRRVLVDLLRAATAAGFPPTELRSIGGVDAAQLVASGEPLDLVFLSADPLHRLASAGHVNPTTVTPLLVSHVAAAATATADVTARAGRAIIRDAADLRRMLLGAESIGYSTGPSGTGLLRMIDAWGLTGTLSARLVQAPAGIPVAKLLADNRVRLGFQQLSELVDQPDVQILGTLPPDCAIDTVFSGGVGSAATDASGASRLLSYLASDATTPIRSAHGFDVPGGK